MNRLWLFTITLFCFSLNAHAMDHRSQYGVGGALGANFAAPWASQDFRNQVGPFFPAFSAWARYIPGTPEIGLELSYNYIGLSQMDFSAHTAILSFISRQDPWGSFHPLFGLGFGYAHTINKFASGNAGIWDDPVVKITIGIEFEMRENIDIGLRVDHYSIFRDTNTQRDMQMLAPMFSFNYYFGTAAPMPAANTTPAPTPVVAPATPAAPEVQPTPAPETEAPPPPTPKKKRAKKRPPGLRPPPVDYDNSN